MLRYLRGGGVARILFAGIAGMIILVFALEFRPGKQGLGGMSAVCAVEYAGSCLDQKDYYAAYGLVVPRGVESREVKRLAIRSKVLEGLVERELLREQARKLGLGVSVEAIEAELDAGRAHVSIPAGEGRALSANLGLCRLNQAGSACEPGTDDMLRQLRVRRTPSGPFDYDLYQREIRIMANRGPKEFKEMQERELTAARLRTLVRSRVRVSNAEAKLVAERAVIRSTIVRRDWFAKYAIDTAPEKIERWAFENRTQVDAAWQTEKTNWTPGCPIIREIVIPVGSLTFDDQKDPARKQALEARTRVAAGQDFALVAREVSQAPSAALGGALGCLSKNSGAGAEDLLKAVEKLVPGQLSEPIETPRGYHVVELLGRVTEQDAESQARRQIALAMYTRFSADEAARGFADRVIEAVQGGQKMEEAVTELTLKSLTNRGGAGGRVPSKAGSDILRTSVAQEAADRPRFEVSPPFNRSGNPLPEVEPKEAIAAKAFELAKPDTLYDKPIETTTGLVVFQLKEIANPENEQKEIESIKQQLLEFKAEQALARYVADLRRQAGDKLKVDRSFAEDRVLSEPQ